MIGAVLVPYPIPGRIDESLVTPFDLHIVFVTEDVLRVRRYASSRIRKGPLSEAWHLIVLEA
jgi:hypothetical protein